MGAPATSTASAEADPLAGAPSVDACYRMRVVKTEAQTNNNSPVDCYADHTTITYHVGTFPDDAVEPDVDTMIHAVPAAAGRGDGTDQEAAGLLDLRVGLLRAHHHPVELRGAVVPLRRPSRERRQAARAARAAARRSSTRASTTRTPLRRQPLRAGSSTSPATSGHTYRWAGYFQAKGGATYPSRTELREAGPGLLQVHGQGRLLGHLAARAPLEHGRPRHELLPEDDRLTAQSGRSSATSRSASSRLSTLPVELRGQLVEEDDLARHLVARQVGLHPRLEVVLAAPSSG